MTNFGFRASRGFRTSVFGLPHVGCFGERILTLPPECARPRAQRFSVGHLLGIFRYRPAYANCCARGRAHSNPTTLAARFLPFNTVVPGVLEREPGLCPPPNNGTVRTRAPHGLPTHTGLRSWRPRVIPRSRVRRSKSYVGLIGAPSMPIFVATAIAPKKLRISPNGSSPVY